jgi:hypothetical protein
MSTNPNSPRSATERSVGREGFVAIRRRARLRKLGRLTLLAVGAVSLLAAALLAVFVFRGHAGPETVWRFRLGLLQTLEAAYIGLLAATLVASPTAGLLLLAARRRKAPGPQRARWFLLGCSLLLGIVAVEVGAAAWRTRLERAGVLALGSSGRRATGAAALASLGNPADVVLPTRFRAPPENGLTLVVLGESSAQGVPFNLYALSVGSLVRWQLEELLPGRAIELVNLAASGDTLERQHLKLARLERRPDVLIIYSGHNEFSARMPWSRDVDHYADDQEPSRWEAVVERVERASPFCGLVRRSADTCRVAIPPPRGGYRSLVDKPAYTPAEFARLRSDFQDRLERIVTYAERLGAVPILIIPPANDSGFEPNRSCMTPETRAAGRDAFAREFHAVRRAEATDPGAAAERYRSLLARQPGFAEAHFRLGRLLAAEGDLDGASRHAIASRDGDGMPMRCPSAFQEVYRTVAARHRAILIDGQALFHAIGRRGLLDDELFMDAMHPSLRGQIALAQAILHGLRAARAFGWPESTPAPVIDPARCAARYGLGPKAWQKFCDWGAVIYDLLAGASHDAGHRLARRHAYEAASARIARGEAPDSLGLPNVGTPQPVPVVPQAVIFNTSSAGPE